MSRPAGFSQTAFQRQRAREANLKHGYASVRTEGRKRSEYKTWLQMVRRCTVPKDTSFRHYGAKGITVCDRWRSGENGLSGFQCFITDMGDKPSSKLSIERKDNMRGYEPGNCVWATRTAQNRNTSKTRVVDWNGERLALRTLCERLGVNFFMVVQRLETLGWPIEKALMAPKVEQPPVQKPTLIVEWQGEQRPFIRLCEQFSIPYPIGIQRIRKLGWSTEKTLTTPVRHTKKSYVII